MNYSYPKINVHDYNIQPSQEHQVILSLYEKISSLSLLSVRILYYLRSLSKTCNMVFPSVGTIAKQVDCHPRTVQTILKQLVGLGILKITPRKRMSNIYHLHWILKDKRVDNLLSMIPGYNKKKSFLGKRNKAQSELHRALKAQEKGKRMTNRNAKFKKNASFFYPPKTPIEANHHPILYKGVNSNILDSQTRERLTNVDRVKSLTMCKRDTNWKNAQIEGNCLSASYDENYEELNRILYQEKKARLRPSTKLRMDGTFNPKTGRSKILSTTERLRKDRAREKAEEELALKAEKNRARSTFMRVDNAMDKPIATNNGKLRRDVINITPRNVRLYYDPMVNLTNTSTAAYDAAVENLKNKIPNLPSFHQIKNYYPHDVAIVLITAIKDLATCYELGEECPANLLEILIELAKFSRICESEHKISPLIKHTLLEAEFNIIRNLTKKNLHLLGAKYNIVNS